MRGFIRFFSGEPVKLAIELTRLIEAVATLRDCLQQCEDNKLLPDQYSRADLRYVQQYMVALEHKLHNQRAWVLKQPGATSLNEAQDQVAPSPSL